MRRLIQCTAAMVVIIGGMFLTTPKQTVAQAPPCGEDCYDCDVHGGGSCMTCCEWVGGVFVGCNTQCH